MINLGEYIALLEDQDLDLMMPIGFSQPHSYRGIYEELAFVITYRIKIGEMLDVAKGCVGQVFQGYKGGDFRMGEYTTVNYQMYEYAVYDGAEIDYLLMRLLFQYAEMASHLEGDVDPDILLQDYKVE
jgi:hypothetical protein